MQGTPEPLYPLGRNGSRDGETYGGDVCAPYDQHLPPYCADDSGKPVVGAEEWCGKAWCWVDQDNCAIAATLSTYWPLAKVSWSYETCGAKNEYAEEPRTCSCLLLLLLCFSMCFRPLITWVSPIPPCWVVSPLGSCGFERRLHSLCRWICTFRPSLTTSVLMWVFINGRAGYNMWCPWKAFGFWAPLV